ncbi:MAG: hypothetical protein WA807_07675, partial [Steroidobacteraceae bacterium]
MQQVALLFSTMVTTAGECRDRRPPPAFHDSCQPRGIASSGDRDGIYLFRLQNLTRVLQASGNI